MRTILHVDMDAYFAAVEVLDHPEYARRPVIVGGTPEGHGVVAAASYEARRYGIHSAMPAARAVKLCPPGIGIYLRPRMERYREVSQRIFEVFNDFTPEVEGLSIDEAFLDVTGSAALFGSGEQIAVQIKERIQKEIGITASVGVASNKFLAKLASDLDKPDGLTIVPRDAPAAFIAPLLVERIWGVGPKLAARLRGVSITTVGALAAHPPGSLARLLGSEEQAAHLQSLARGEDSRLVTVGYETKSISHETTLATFVDDADTIEAILLDLAVAVARRMRKADVACRTVHLKVRDDRFRTMTRSQTLGAPTCLTDVLYRTALDLLRQRVNLSGRKVRLLGVGGSGLVPRSEVPVYLFSDPREDKLQAVEKAADAIVETYGVDAIQRARQLQRPMETE